MRLLWPWLLFFSGRRTVNRWEIVIPAAGVIVLASPEYPRLCQVPGRNPYRPPAPEAGLTARAFPPDSRAITHAWKVPGAALEVPARAVPARAVHAGEVSAGEVPARAVPAGEVSAGEVPAGGAGAGTVVAATAVVGALAGRAGAGMAARAAWSSHA